MTARAALQVACLPLAFEGDELKLLTVEPSARPYAPELCCGAVQEGEALDQAAQRILEQQTHARAALSILVGVQDQAASEPRVLRFGFLQLLPPGGRELRAGAEIGHVAMTPFPPSKLPEADQALGELAQRALGQFGESLVFGSELLPESFPLSDLKRIQELCLGRSLDGRMFRQRVLASELLTPTGERQQGVSHRPAELYRVDGRRQRPLSRAWRETGLVACPRFPWPKAGPDG